MFDVSSLIIHTNIYTRLTDVYDNKMMSFSNKFTYLLMTVIYFTHESPPLYQKTRNIHNRTYKNQILRRKTIETRMKVLDRGFSKTRFLETRFISNQVFRKPLKSLKIITSRR
jgi:hypothetical protein